MGNYITNPVEKECIYCKEKFIAKDKRFTVCNKKHTYTCKMQGCNEKYEVECANKNYFLFSTHKINFCMYHRIYNIRKECVACKDVFYAQNKTWEYCNNKKTKICDECNKKFTYICSANKSKQRFCSRKCQINNLHKNYNMQEHNKKLWENPNHREKVSNIMKNRVVTEEQREKIRERQKLTKEKIDELNRVNKDTIFLDKYAKFNRDRLLKQYLLYTPEKISLYIYSFKNKEYIKIGVSFNNRRLLKWKNEGGVLEYLLQDNPLFIINAEALIHSCFKRVWQIDFIDGKTEFHYKKDIKDIIYFVNKVKNIIPYLGISL